MRIVMAIMVALLCTGVVFAATSSQLKKATPTLPGVKTVKGSIQLGPRAGQLLDDARKPKNISNVAYIKTPGFKGAGIAPKGFVDLRAPSKVEAELKAKQVRSANKLAPGKYQSLVDALKRGNQTRR